MSQPPAFSRQAIRAALRVHEHLQGAGSLVNVGALPAGRWQELRRVSSRFELAQQRNWRVASASVVSELDYQLRRFTSELESIRTDLSQARHQERISPASVIAADLLALSAEFEAVSIDLKEKVLRVDTTEIVLEETYLGPFRIVLHWEQIGQTRAYQVVAQKPNCAGDRSDVTHPHVEDHHLCEGAGASAIRSALVGGRLLDFFLLVRQILQTYNPGSAYVSLGDWSGDGSDDVVCEDCGYQTSSEDCTCCERCDRQVCDDCSRRCPQCESSLCSSCATSCDRCSQSFCDSCLSRSGDGEQACCQACLTQQGTTDP